MQILIRAHVVALLLILGLFCGLLSARSARADESHAAYWLAEAARAAAQKPAPQARLHPADRLRRAPPHRHAVAPASAPLLAVAARYVGARNPTGTIGPWCRDFVNYVLVRAGVPLTDRSRKARDAVRLGRRVSDPRPGDLAVMRSHVTIVAGFEGARVVGLGGNQCGGRVCLSRYAASRVIAYVRVGA